MATPVYTTPAQVRLALGGISATVLTDAAANELILQAEDITDDLLGVWPIDATTGRKITQASVETWQWDKLGRFVANLAAKLYRDPGLAGARWNTVSGPDFSRSGLIGSPVGAGLMNILNQTGLRRLTTSVGRSGLTIEDYRR